ncbi:MAG: hypothetical protein ABIC36_02600 [bacterium]
MSLINFIEKIQQKPRYVRIRILWISVFVCMIVVVSAWVFSLKISFSSFNQGIKITNEVSEPLNKIKDDTISLKDAFKASISAFFEKDLLELETKGQEEQIENQDNNIEENKDSYEESNPAILPLAD